jgi:cellulose synthase/poly-beta-1,6-N-acetylglucosamine synthase-like glycosyltransferase
MHWLAIIPVIPYLIVIFLIYREISKIKPFHFTHLPSTSVSVIIACRNEEHNLTDLVAGLAQQNYPAGLFEVILVDDNSTDNSFDTAQRYSGKLKLLTIKNNGKGKKQALRTGINASSGSLIITTDCDCRMGFNWVQTIAAFYEKNKSDLIICPVRIKSDNSFSGNFQEIEFMSLQGITAGTAVLGNSTMCNGANLAFSKAAYYKHSENLHDEIDSGDDIFLLQSIKKDKGKIQWLESTDAIISTSLSDTFMNFTKQRRRWISKWKAYSDLFTIILAIVTFVTIITQICLLVASIFSIHFLKVFLVIYFLKSIADYLIIRNTAKRYGNMKILTWFIPAQIIYPFYVIWVVILSQLFLKRQ